MRRDENNEPTKGVKGENDYEFTRTQRLGINFQVERREGSLVGNESQHYELTTHYELTRSSHLLHASGARRYEALTIMSLMGHKDLKTTMRYIRAFQPQRDVRPLQLVRELATNEYSRQ